VKRPTVSLALLAVVAVAVALGAVRPAHAWEPDSTHAGLTEQAALASRVHARLVAFFERRGGWLEPLRLAPERAPVLYEKLALLEPSSGVVPDKAGRQSALAWLLAGAVVEGIPAVREENHFYDPLAKRGLPGKEGASLGVILQSGVISVGGHGVPAPDWIVAKDNELGLPRFWLELERSVTAPGPGERDEHLVLAFLCAGAMMHVLEDMGEPARVRGDLDEFLLPLGGGPRDRGSRFERLAALLYGRLGVPAPGKIVERKHARDFFTAADHLGLADVTSAGYYSSGTLPADVILPASPRPGAVPELVARASKLPSPRPERELDLTATPGPGPYGHVLRTAGGVCLANYRVEDSTLRFNLSDDCAAEQIRALLPEIGSYATGLLEHLFRGALTVVVNQGSIDVSVPSSALQLGAGQLTFVAEDANGRRNPIGTGELHDGAARMAAPAGATRVFVIFRGVDVNGEPLVAVGSGVASH
jgi:hypothetical protein